MSRRKRRRNALRRASGPGQQPRHFESLEPRVLLTILVGGDTFEFQAPDPNNPLALGPLIRLTVSGATIIELVGADIVQGSILQLGDLPGKIYGIDGRTGADHGTILRPQVTGFDGGEILGGVGGRDGVEPVTILTPLPPDVPFPDAITPIVDPRDPNNNIPFGVETVDDINLAGLASRDLEGNGDTYSINAGTVTVDGSNRQVVQLVQLDIGAAFRGGPITGNVRAAIGGGTLREDFVGLVTGDPFNAPVTAFAIEPSTGVGYAVANGALFSISRLTAEVTFIDVITSLDPLTGVPRPIGPVQAMDFNDDGELFIITRDYDGDPETDSSGIPIGLDDDGLVFSTQDVALIRVDKDNATFDEFADRWSILIADEDTGLLFETELLYTGMVFIGQDDIRAVSGGTMAQFHRIIITGDPPPNAVVAVNLGDVEVDGDNAQVEGLAVGNDAFGVLRVVGLDNSSDDGGRLISFPDPLSPDAIALGEPGRAQGFFFANEQFQVLSPFQGLSSFPEGANSDPVLFATDGIVLTRGSSNSLPTDPNSGETLVEEVQAAAFSPIDGRLYFVAEIPFEISADETIQRDALFKIDVTAGTRSAIQSSLRQVGVFPVSEDEGATKLTSIVWDQFGPEFALLLGFNSNEGQIIDIVPNPFNPNAVISSVRFAVGDADDPVTGITALAFFQDDPDFLEEDLLAVLNAGPSSQLLRINTFTGDFKILGPLPDPDDPDFLGVPDAEGVVAIRGEDLQGMSFNPIMPNPFVGGRGVLLATDTSSGELVFVDHRDRRPTATIFQIYVTQSSINSNISIAVIPEVIEINPFDLPDELPDQPIMAPFSGSIGFVRTLDLDPESPTFGDFICVAAPGNTGEVYIGGRTELPPDPDIGLCEVNGPDQIAFVNGSLDQTIGTRAVGIDDVPGIGFFANVAAGIIIEDNLLSFIPGAGTSGLGQNFDIIKDLAISRNAVTSSPLIGGRLIVVVDGDEVDEFGERVGDQLALVADRGGAGTPVTIADVATDRTISGLQAMDFGDVNLDGFEELYAIMTLRDPLPQDRFDIDGVGGSLFGDFDIQALTVTGGGIMYAINDDGTGTLELLRINRSGAGAVTSITTVGRIATATGLDIPNITALEADPTDGALYAVGTNPAGEKALFVVNVNPFDLEPDGRDDVVAVEIGTFGFADSVSGLAFSNDGQTLFGARNTVGTDTLININPGTAAVTTIGQITVDHDLDPFTAAQVVSLQAIEVAADGELVGIDRGSSSGGGRLIIIDTLFPGQSKQLSEPGLVPASLQGYGADAAGFFYSIQTNPGNEELFVSPPPQP